MPTEAEWEYAARAGTQTRRDWGDDTDHRLACIYANVLDQAHFDEIKNRGYDVIQGHDCQDAILYTAPVGQFGKNEFGLNNMLGNVWEWVADSYHDSYKRAPPDGASGVKIADCESGRGVNRGGSWTDEPGDVRSTYRH